MIEQLIQLFIITNKVYNDERIYNSVKIRSKRSASPSIKDLGKLHTIILSGIALV